MASAPLVKGSNRKGSTPKPSKPEINLSQIQEWNKCRYRWDLRYRREIDRREMHRPMDLGTAVHAGLAAAIQYFGAQEVRTKAIFRRTDTSLVDGVENAVTKMVERMGGWDSMMPEEQLQAQEILDVGVAVARRTLGFLRLERWQTYWYKDAPLVEQRIYVDTPDFTYHFTPDWVAEDLDEGGVWVLDYKIRKQFTPREAEDINVQFPAYQYGLLSIGLATTGSIMFQSKSYAPTLPKLNQNGSMSRQKIACDWENYKEALITAGLDPADYEGDMKSKLTTEFYREERVFRNQPTIVAFWDNLVLPAAYEMLSREKQVHRHMNYMNCQGCWAKEFCLAELYQEDTEFLLHTSYLDLKDPAPRHILRPEDVSFTDE